MSYIQTAARNSIWQIGITNKMKAQNMSYYKTTFVVECEVGMVTVTIGTGNRGSI